MSVTGTEVIAPLAAPFQIGATAIPNRVVLGPMAGITNSAYRRHLKAHGAGLVITEMVSAHGLVHSNRRTHEYVGFTPTERPLAVQLFAADPQVMAAAAEAVLSLPQAVDVLDINMGCPARKVVRTGAGAALLDDLGKAVAVATAVVRVATPVGIPVTVKLRSGLRAGECVAVELARRLEEVGVSGLEVHPRTAGQLYGGTADHTVTAEVVAAVEVPVIASGDVTSVKAALAIWEATGATALMVARGAVGNPWLVGDLLAGHERGKPSLAAVIADLRLLLSRVACDLGTERAARWARKLLSRYLRPAGVPGTIVERLTKLRDAEALDAALASLVDIWEGPPYNGPLFTGAFAFLQPQIDKPWKEGSRVAQRSDPYA